MENQSLIGKAFKSICSVPVEVPQRGKFVMNAEGTVTEQYGKKVKIADYYGHIYILTLKDFQMYNKFKN